MKFKTLIFDLDGTLLNTIDDLTDSLNYALSKNNLNTYSVEEVKYFVGSGIKVMVERALGNNQKDFSQVFNDFVEHYNTNSTNKTALYPNVRSTVEKLAKMGVKMAIVSNKYQLGVETICKPLLGDIIEVMVGEQPGLNKKPSRDMVDYAIEKLGIDRNSCAYVGDSDIDVMTSKNSNLPCIGCAYGFRDRQVLEKLGAEYIIDKFEDILEIIK